MISCTNFVFLQGKSRYPLSMAQASAVLAFDLGGTKLLGGIVDARGRPLSQMKVPTQTQDGPQGLIDQVAELGEALMSKSKVKISAVGIGSAGPLDPVKGELLDPTNFISQRGSSGGSSGWGQIALAGPLSRRWKKPVFLDNDAACALLAEQAYGAAQGLQNAMTVTLGTGVGTAAIANGKLVRSGRMLHTEAGHITLRADDKTAPCGCGNLGCIEAYLSGKGFERRFGILYGKVGLSAREIVALARAGDRQALLHFEEMAHLLAVAIQNFVVLYAPERIVLAGSFAAASPLFLSRTRAELPALLKRRRVGKDLLPEVVVSRLRNRSGWLGAARLALMRGRV